MLQDDKFAVKEELEECKNIHEHLKHKINPISQLVATINTSEVRQVCECCNFNQHIHLFRIFILKTLKTEKLIIA